MGLLNGEPIHFFEVLYDRFHVHLIIDWETVKIR
jgi:hypothetical protein